MPYLLLIAGSSSMPYLPHLSTVDKAFKNPGLLLTAGSASSMPYLLRIAGSSTTPYYVLLIRYFIIYPII